MSGLLYVVATPIGNYDDISLRALNLIRECDILIVESFRETARLLRHHGIKREMVQIDKNNEESDTPDLVMKIRTEELTACLVSDCGTPLFADPGTALVPMALSFGIKVVPVPGPSSLMAALSVNALNIQKFYYYGWLPQKTDERKTELYRLSKFRDVIVFLETPYRLQKLLAETAAAFGPGTQAELGYDISLPSEKFYRGSLKHLSAQAQKENLKGEFVLIVDNRNNR
ncbi:MAG: 16S rRNA (cytidine(1402)-2'-O)-methyltransferase [Ignavibacteriaceae bacterium]|nr:16S rRNA (cytidine(1402)-2'-O)-methyltransferase [Ignavibacteriaceae bacterium]NUM70555.1 16S rRNA (cytidine(1402)-2'-O)-methyltransferase [Ignavibacteriaceae bacterium]